MYELHLLVESETRLRAAKAAPSRQADDSSSPSTAPAWLSRQTSLLAAVLYNNPPLLLDFLKNTCDIFIPLDRLGIYPTGSGFVGACGLTSSILSLVTMVHPWLKLKP